VPAKDRPVQPEFLDQPDDAARLRVGAVLHRRVGRVLVGPAEAAQVGHHDLGRWQQRDNVAVIRPVTRPSMQQHRGRTSAGPLVPKPKPINRNCPIHACEDSPAP
jgi:hypothetical protein